MLLCSLSLRGWSSVTHLELSAADHLESLNLGSCVQLLSLKLSTPRLARLSASSCLLLVTAELECESLTHLVLNLCKRLQLLHFSCAAPLSVLNLHSCRQLGVPALWALLQAM